MVFFSIVAKQIPLEKSMSLWDSDSSQRVLTSPIILPGRMRYPRQSGYAEEVAHGLPVAPLQRLKTRADRRVENLVPAECDRSQEVFYRRPDSAKKEKQCHQSVRKPRPYDRKTMTVHLFMGLNASARPFSRPMVFGRKIPIVLRYEESRFSQRDDDREP